MLLRVEGVVWASACTIHIAVGIVKAIIERETVAIVERRWARDNRCEHCSSIPISAQGQSIGEGREKAVGWVAAWIALQYTITRFGANTLGWLLAICITGLSDEAIELPCGEVALSHEIRRRLDGAIICFSSDVRFVEYPSVGEAVDKHAALIIRVRERNCHAPNGSIGGSGADHLGGGIEGTGGKDLPKAHCRAGLQMAATDDDVGRRMVAGQRIGWIGISDLRWPVRCRGLLPGQEQTTDGG